MKIVLSRKGFDSTAGGHPSLIFRDSEKMVSIPIPTTQKENDIGNSLMSYKDFCVSRINESIPEILNDLNNKNIFCKDGTENNRHSFDYTKDESYRMHYDPQVLKDNEGNEYMIFGQVGAAERHLQNQGIQENDIFIFFGWFKEIEKRNEKWSYVDPDKDLHVVWGGMVIDKVFDLKNEGDVKDLKKNYSFLKNHPHYTNSKQEKIERIYISRHFSLLDFNEDNVLTDRDPFINRSLWRLPEFFHRPEAWTFIKRKWKQKDKGPLFNLSYRGYGQEFVFNLEHRTVNQTDKNSVIEWVETILKLKLRD